MEDIGGIGYINPVDALWFMFAFGIEFDNTVVSFVEQNLSLTGGAEARVVKHISGSKEFKEWTKYLQDMYGGGDKLYKFG